MDSPNSSGGVKAGVAVRGLVVVVLPPSFSPPSALKKKKTMGRATNGPGGVHPHERLVSIAGMAQLIKSFAKSPSAHRAHLQDVSARTIKNDWGSVRHE